MELRHIYKIASSVKSGLSEFSEVDNVLKDVTVSVSVSGSTHYGIDKEFYRLTHNNSTDGFEHNDNLIDANIDGVRFLIHNKNINDTNSKNA